MESSRSVPRDSSLACIKWNFKPLLLTNLSVRKLQSLCTQISPQYKLVNRNCWSEFGTFDCNILSDLTNFLKWNGKWSEVPYIQAFWDLQSHPSLCKDCSIYQILLCSLPHSITKESKSKAPKTPPKPSAPDFDLADEPFPYRPGEKASRDETLTLLPPRQEEMTLKPQKRFPPLSISQNLKQRHFLLER